VKPDACIAAVGTRAQVWHQQVRRERRGSRKARPGGPVLKCARPARWLHGVPSWHGQDCAYTAASLGISLTHSHSEPKQTRNRNQPLSIAVRFTTQLRAQSHEPRTEVPGRACA
jgi:hypothetical protein